MIQYNEELKMEQLIRNTTKESLEESIITCKKSNTDKYGYCSRLENYIQTIKNNELEKEKKDNYHVINMDNILDYILDSLSKKILSFSQRDMCWDPSDQQIEIVNERYKMCYPCGSKDENLKDISKRMQRTLQSQLVEHTLDIKKIRKFENLMEYLFINRLFILNTPQIFNLGVGIEKKYFDIYPQQMELVDYWNIFYASKDNSKFTTQACFILDLEDSVRGIFKTITDSALIQKAGGGIGFNLGRLRPKDQNIVSTNTSSSGSLSFLRLFNSTGDIIKQGNKRRWAGMAVLSDLYTNFLDSECTLHPDTMDFINQKQDNNGNNILQNFNISIGINNSKSLIEKYNNNQKIYLTFEGKPFNDIIHIKNDEEKSDITDKYSINQVDILNKIAQNAHKSGDPGLLFLDKINYYNPMRQSGLYMIQCNPCGERPGISSEKYNMYDTCDLGHIDLTKILNRDPDTKLFNIDYDILFQLSYISSYILDLLHDLQMYPIQEVKKGVIGLRSIGLGFYGLIGSLMLMGIPYDSLEQRTISNNIMKTMEAQQSYMSFTVQDQLYPFILQSGYQSSEIPTQPMWDNNSKDLPINNDIFENKSIDKNFKINLDETITDLKTLYDIGQNRRNINLTTIQPTGTTSIIGQTNILGDTGSGIEPFFLLYYNRNYVNNDGTITTQKYDSKLFYKIINDIDLLNRYLDHNPDLKQMCLKEFKNDSVNINDQIERLVYITKLQNSSTDKSILNMEYKKDDIQVILRETLKKWIELHFTQGEIDYKDHLKMQEQVQYSCSSAISKTINMKNQVKIKDVLDQYLYQLQSPYIKGITIYRDGSLDSQVLNSQETKDSKKKLENKLNMLRFNIDVDEKSGRITPKDKPTIMESLKKTVIFKDDINNKKYHIEIGFTDNNDPFEVFIRTTESSQNDTSICNLYGRLQSIQFRSGIDIYHVLNQQKKVKKWNNEYDSLLIFITHEIEDMIQISKRGIKQKKQMIDTINEKILDQNPQQVNNNEELQYKFEKNISCSVCGE